MIIIPQRPWNFSMPDPSSAPSDPTSDPVSNPAFNPPPPFPPMPNENRSQTGTLIIGIILIIFGLHFLLRNVFYFNPFYWWIWNEGWRYFLPSVLIAVGVLILLKSTRKS
jgi:hypothetical protein